MTNNNFTALLRHESLPETLAADLRLEVACGMGKDTKLLLAATVEGYLTESHPTYCRLTVLDPLPAGRLLAKDALIGKRLWKESEKTLSVARIERTTALVDLLDYYCRARREYRRREKSEAAGLIRYADGRPADLSTLKAA